VEKSKNLQEKREKTLYFGVKMEEYFLPLETLVVLAEVFLNFLKRRNEGKNWKNEQTVRISLFRSLFSPSFSFLSLVSVLSFFLSLSLSFFPITLSLSPSSFAAGEQRDF
jgi:hypothetical protein